MPDPYADLDLVMVEWHDTTNIAAWTTVEEVEEWAPEGSWVCRNIGYLVYEDFDCVVLAARTALDANPPQVGLYERVPTRAITGWWRLSAAQVDMDSRMTAAELEGDDA